MSQIDPQLIPKGLNVITDLKVTFIKLQQSTTPLLIAYPARQSMLRLQQELQLICMPPQTCTSSFC